MKLVYYKGLIADKFGLTSTERILYSFLLNSSLKNADDVFDENGEYIGSVLEDYDELMVDDLQQNKIATKTRAMSQPAISIAYHGLIEKGFIDIRSKMIKTNGLYSKGYFTLIVDSGLRGELLIFYSWLKELSKNNPIVAKMDKLRIMYNATPSIIKDYLHRLFKKELIQRDENGNLIIK